MVYTLSGTRDQKLLDDVQGHPNPNQNFETGSGMLDGARASYETRRFMNVSYRFIKNSCATTLIRHKNSQAT